MKVIHISHKATTPMSLVGDCGLQFHLRDTPPPRLPDVSFLHPYQHEILQQLLAGESVHVTKARQIGMTTLAAVYAEIMIYQFAQRPAIITSNSHYKRDIERLISDRVGNDRWKSLPASWYMVDEAEMCDDSQFSGIGGRQMFSYSTPIRGLPYSLRFNTNTHFHTITYLDAFPNNNDKFDEMRRYMGETTFRQEYLCERV